MRRAGCGIERRRSGFCAHCTGGACGGRAGGRFVSRFWRNAGERRDACAAHAMARLGADVCKIAVMPRDIRDVSRLKAVCMQANDELPQPIIAISMGELGASTRTDAEAMGSCLSFGTAGRAARRGRWTRARSDRRLKRRTQN